MVHGAKADPFGPVTHSHIELQTQACHALQLFIKPSTYQETPIFNELVFYKFAVTSLNRRCV